MNIYDIAKEAAKVAGIEILKVYQKPNFEQALKSDDSPLTEADTASHNAIKPFLEKTGIPILSEEGKSIPFDERKDWNQFWCVDPLDGTKEFIKRNGEFTVNIALIEHGKSVFGVVYLPVDDILYWGGPATGSFRQKGNQEPEKLSVAMRQSPVRVVASRSHINAETEAFINDLGETTTLSRGSSLKFLLVAEGAADVYPRFGPTMEWDTAAAEAVVLGAGGTVTKEDGSPMEYNKENLLNPYFIVSGK